MIVKVLQILERVMSVVDGTNGVAKDEAEAPWRRRFRCASDSREDEAAEAEAVEEELAKIDSP